MTIETRRSCHHHSRRVVSSVILVVVVVIVGTSLLASQQQQRQHGAAVIGWFVHANPNSKPYIPFRTDPYDQPKVHHDVKVRNSESDDAKDPSSGNNKKPRLRIYEPDNAVEDPQCPLHFSLGVSRRTHNNNVPPGMGGNGGGGTAASASMAARSSGTTASSSSSSSTPLGIQQPPVIYPILPWHGPGRQIVYTTQYEHLDMLTPSKGSIRVATTGDDDEDMTSRRGRGGTGGGAGSSSSIPKGNIDHDAFASSFIKEGMVQHVEFPLLFESSVFQTSPVLGDVNGDGIIDAILTDYHGGLYAIGLQVPTDKKRRYFHRAQVPRLYVRRQWLEAKVNETLGIDPYEEEKKREEEEEAAAAAAEEEAAKTQNASSTALPPKDETIKTKPIRAREQRPYDPYHSYFEYSYGGGTSNTDHEPILRGVTADVLGQDHEHVKGLEERRGRSIVYDPPAAAEEEEKKKKEEEKVVFDSLEEEEKHQKVIFDSLEEEEKKQKIVYDSLEEEEKKEKIVYDSFEEEEKERKVVFDSLEEEEKDRKVVYDSIEQDGSVTEQKGSDIGDREQEKANHRRLQEVGGETTLTDRTGDTHGTKPDGLIAEAMRGGPPIGDDGMLWGDDVVVYDAAAERKERYENEAAAGEGRVMEDAVKKAAENGAGDVNDGASEDANEAVPEDFDDEYRSFEGGGARPGDDTYPRYDDHSLGRYDDYYAGRYNSAHNDYFDDKHYVRLPPHILCTPVLVEMPKLYSSNAGETESLLFLAVSYYFDEDEYEGFFSYKRFANKDQGDETETQRGMYLSSAIMIYHFGDSPRWGRQEHLDMSCDHSAPVNMTLVGSIPMREDNTKLGAFALSSPTVADIDGDGSLEVLMGTSMGLLYVLDSRNLYEKANWPVQFQYGIESRILVEDVRGDTNLEIFVADVGGNVVCLDHTGNKVWHRNLVQSVSKDAGSEVVGSSPMQLGDVDGDGILDIVILLKIKIPQQGISRFLFALTADTGKDLPGGYFPIDIWTKRVVKKQNENVGEDFVHEKLPPALLVDMHGDQDHISAYIKRNGSKWTKPGSKSKDSKAPHGGSAGGLHIVQPIESHLVIVEGGSGCTQNIEIGEDLMSMVQADDVHGTNKLDLIISTVAGNVVTLESEAPFHPLNVWNHGELRSRTNAMVHGYSASQGIFVHEVSRQFRDIFGVYVPVTFEIFDNRPNIQNEPDKRKYNVEVREGTSRLVFRKTFNTTGIYTERLFLPFGPGYYIMSVILKTSHGLVYEDTFHIGYNVNYMDGFGLLLWLPLTIATIGVFLMGTKKTHWDDDDYQADSRNGRQGILGSDLPE